MSSEAGIDKLAALIETKDVVYFVGGLALLGLTALPMVRRNGIINMPLLYVAVGAFLALVVPDWPVLDPRRSETARVLVEHLTELIVIVALAGAGLAVDREAGAREWHHSWVLLGVVMPATVAAVYGLGRWFGLDPAGAMLLAAALAPTDPVLARAVAVSGPNQGEEDDVRVSLTTEAGLNDGLAFPFVWLALALAASAEAGTAVDWSHWLWFDVAWRVVAALGIGRLIGALSARFVHGPWGDSHLGGANAGLVLLGGTFFAYGATEMLDGYGFLAVFIAARAGRSYGKQVDQDDYAEKPHQYSDQFEKILLAALLLWLGSLAASGVLFAAGWRDWAVAGALIFVVRPLLAYLALILTRGSRLERFAIAFFGIRGMGSFFYLSYAMGHATFVDVDEVWRLTTVTVLVSILLHGALAPVVMRRLARKGSPGD